jgi:hypothetical protein
LFWAMMGGGMGVFEQSGRGSSVLRAGDNMWWCCLRLWARRSYLKVFGENSLE